MQDKIDGDVELPDDWHKGLPDDLLGDIEQFVLVDDSTLGADRVDGLRFLMNVIADADGLDQVRQWVADHSGSDLVLAENKQGVLESATGDVQPWTRTIVLPERLLSEIASQIMTFPVEDERVRRESSLSEGLDELLGWLVDHEKLIGHLVVVHGSAAGVSTKDHDELIKEHAELHRRHLSP